MLKSIFKNVNSQMVHSVHIVEQSVYRVIPLSLNTDIISKSVNVFENIILHSFKSFTK